MKQIEKNQRNQKNKIWAILAIIFGNLFIACVVWLITYLVQSQRAEAQLEELKDAYVQEILVDEVPMEEDPEKALEGTSEGALDETLQEEADLTKEAEEPEQEEETDGALAEYDVPEKIIDWAALQEENADIYAWITVPGTVIDYPVLQHSEELDYYLNHNLDGSSGYPGCIYTQMMNSKEWDDPQTVLYGHNMKNGTMFAGLHQYEDSLFFEENPYVYIYSEDCVRVYRIFAAYEFSSAHLLLTFDTKNPETFEAYLGGIFQRDGLGDNFNRELEVTAEDKILTLSTCITNKPDNRYLVQAVLVAEGTIE